LYRRPCTPPGPVASKYPSFKSFAHRWANAKVAAQIDSAQKTQRRLPREKTEIKSKQTMQATGAIVRA